MRRRAITRRLCAHFEQAMTEYPEFASNQMMLIVVYWKLGRKGDATRMGEWLRRRGLT